MISFLLSIIIPILIGFYIISTIEKTLPTPLKAVLGIPIGLGITSIFYFVWIYIFNGNWDYYPYIETILATATTVLFIKKGLLPKWKINTQFTDKYTISYIAFACISLLGFIAYTIKNPFGSWDGWRLWNTKAQFLFSGSEQWQNVFYLPSALSHNDYPLMLSASVARIWAYCKSDTIFAPIAIALIVTYSIPALVKELYSIFNKNKNGIIIATSILATPFFITCGATQCADILLALFFLSSISLFILGTKNNSSKLMILCGITTGLCGWVKNEGLIFIFLMTFLILSWALIKKEYKKAWRYLAGLIPILAFLGFFKYHWPIQNDISYGLEHIGLWAQITDISRYTKILKSLLIFIIKTPLTYTLITLWIFFKNKDQTKEQDLSNFIKSISLLMVIAYLCIYLLTPNNIDWQLKFSFDRLMTQLIGVFAIVPLININKLH